ncbi:MAG: MFS transporter [Oceanospirillaceae bacterium]|nr:MFS transporter [Oceanospirillaceae bacterium]
MVSEVPPRPIPRVRLSGFYLFYFAFLGALVPYWSLYLQSFGFGPEVIGLLMGLLHATRIFAPSLWGWIADRTGRRIWIVRLGSCCAWLIFGLIFWAETPLYIALVTVGFSFFWNAILPQFEVVTLRYLGEQKHRYSRIRVWGSVGFIAAVGVIGYLLDSLSIRALPFMLLGLLVLIWINTLLVNQHESSVEHEPVGKTASLKEVLMQGQVVAFFLICFLVQFGHGPYYSFFSPMMESLGYSRSMIGLMWSLGVLAEVVLFIWMHRVLERWSLRTIMLASLWLSVLRWVVTAYLPEYPVPMLLAQLLHAATFGSLHIVGITLVQHYFPPSTQGRGQALFSSLGFGAGGMAGAFAAGLIWNVAGSEAAFLAAAVGCLLAIVLTSVWIYPEKAQQNQS